MLGDQLSDTCSILASCSHFRKEKKSLEFGDFFEESFRYNGRFKQNSNNSFLHIDSFSFFLHLKFPMHHKNCVCSLNAPMIHIAFVPHPKIRYQNSSLNRLVVTFVEIIIVQASTFHF